MATRPNSQVVEEEDGVQTAAPDIGTLAVLNKSEIDQQIATARHYPRSIVKFRNEALQLCTLDERTAAECIYSLPRRQWDPQEGEWIVKTIEGPSARFSEIINYAWGNTRAGARIVAEEEDFVVAQGLFYDLEKNTAISYEVRRSITGKRGRYSADMIGVTANAASSIALRNAICKGIPKALWKQMYDSARAVVAGDVRTLVSRRDEAIKAFAIFGVNPEMIFQTLGVRGVQDVTIDHLVTLKGLLTAIQEGDTTPEQAFAPPSTQDHNLAGKSSEVLNGIKERYAKSSAGAAANGGHTESSADPQKGGAVPTPPLPLTPEEQKRKEYLQAEVDRQRRELDERQRGKKQEEVQPTQCASPEGLFGEG
jgi:hypothetical protein